MRPDIGDLLRDLPFRAAGGPVVVCEGDLNGLDQQVFEKWAAHAGARVAFRGVGGWPSVVWALQAVPGCEPRLSLYGIVDRDVTPIADVGTATRAVDPPGLLRLPYYSLESYLLEPEGWVRVARALAGLSSPQAEWGTVKCATERIAEHYQAVAHAAVHNRVVSDLAARYSDHPQFSRRTHWDSVDAIRGEPDVRALVLSWASSFADEGEAARLVDQAEHDVGSAEGMRVHVPGKLVLRMVQQDLSGSVRGGFPSTYQLLSLYIHEYPEAPEHILALFHRIACGSL